MRNTFSIYDASAGSGKTYMLVQKYLCLLLTGTSTDTYRHILAITFTNRAVGEMKSRILSGLIAVSDPMSTVAGVDLRNQLASETGLSQEEVASRSRNILYRIIHDYAAFEVSTIDRFTQRLLRTFSKDLSLPPNFEVEMKTEEVLSEAVDRLIDRAGENKRLTDVLVKFVLQKIDEDKSWDVSKELLKIGKILTRETDRIFVEKLSEKPIESFLQLSDRIQSSLKDLDDRLKEISEGFFQLLKENELEDKDFSGAYCPKFFRKIIEKNYSVGFDALWQKKIATDPLYAKSLLEEKKIVLDRIQPLIAESFLLTKTAVLKIEFLKALQKNLLPLSLLRLVQAEVEQIKSERSLVLISDFNSIIHKAVKDEPAPFVYERLGEQYRHYFIDEFQDTSQLQWENLIPLIDHVLSSATDVSSGSLTIVGDAKQSIYRWRGGKAEQFIDLCQQGNPFSLKNKDVVVLPKNYRSAKSIVSFNNSFFKFSERCLGKEEYKKLFAKSSQEVTSKSEGYINISFLETENAEDEQKKYPAKVFEIILDLEKKNIRKSDICILTRRRSESRVIAQYLNEHGIDVISAESLLVGNSREVNLINSVLRLSLEPENKLLKFEIVSYLIDRHQPPEDQFSFTDTRLRLDGQRFFDSLRSLNIDFDLSFFESLSVYEAAEYIVQKFALVTGSNAYVQFYLDFIYETVHEQGKDLYSFFEVWDSKKEELSIVVPEKESAVQIMTIHKAKGLEFPVVIYPFVSNKIQDTSRTNLWIDLPTELREEVPVGFLDASPKMKNWEGDLPRLYEDLCCNSELDAINVLYVALTRPERQLYIISKFWEEDKIGKVPKDYSQLLVAYLVDIGKWDGSRTYEFGDPADLPSLEPIEAISIAPKSFVSSSERWRELAVMPLHSDSSSAAQLEAQQMGNFIHELFSKVYTAADLEVVLNNLSTSLGPEERSDISSIMMEVINHPELKYLFSEDVQVYNERSIVSGTGELFRPDRVVIEKGKASIIDYKTGVEKEEHRTQLKKYESLLKEMGLEVQKKFLVYLGKELRVSLV